MIIYMFTFILAFCSIVYELLLGQSLSAFMGNTVLRYSVTIGLYMLSMGIGSLFAEGRFVRQPVTMLLKIELLLTLTGGFSVILLLFLDTSSMPPSLFSAIAHLLIVIIGILTGFEIPLLIQLRNLETGRSKNSVLGIDYLGAFCGTVVFAFLFYPIVGLVPTAFCVASLNAAVGIGLLTQAPKVGPLEIGQFRTLIGFLSVIFVVLAVCLVMANDINELFLKYYLGL
jgi:spermidine synthase